MFSISPSTTIPAGAGGILAREGENVTIFVPAEKIAEETAVAIGVLLTRLQQELQAASASGASSWFTTPA